MADTQEQSLSEITPVDGDYFRAVDDPGGSPASSNVTGTALKAYLKTYFDTLYYGVSQVAYVTSDFSSTEDTTLNDITGLTITVASGGVYRFNSFLMIANNASGGTKVSVSGTATATATRWRASFVGSAAIAVTTASALDEAEGETAAHQIVRVEGYIEVDVGGTLTLQAAQNASNANATTIRKGSWWQVDKIG